MVKFWDWLDSLLSYKVEIELWFLITVIAVALYYSIKDYILNPPWR